MQSSVSYTLGNNVENLTLTGSANINATGNSLANVLTGNSGANVLTGGAGPISIDGGPSVSSQRSAAPPAASSPDSPQAATSAMKTRSGCGGRRSPWA